MEDPKPDIASTGSSNKVTRLRGRSLPDTCKLVYGKALELSKYDHFENGSVMKKGHIFVGKKSIPLEEYRWHGILFFFSTLPCTRKHVNNLLDVFDQLGIQYATSVSQYLRKQYPESDKVVQKLKSFYAQLEANQGFLKIFQGHWLLMCTGWNCGPASQTPETKISTPLKSAEETEVQSQVFMFDASTKFQTMEAVFTGLWMKEFTPGG